MNPASCAAHGAGAVDACIVSGAMRSGNRQNAPSGEFPDSVLQLPEFRTDRAMCRNRWRTAGKAACPRSRAELKAQPPPAEPAVYTQREGTPDASWKYLLQNQPHDSICGCSVDQVHIDMRYRYDQTMEIGAELLSRSMDWLLKKEEPGKKNRLSFYNPFPYDWEAPIRLEVPMSQTFPASFAEPAGYEQRCSFRLFDGQNREIPYQIHQIRRNVVHRLKAQQNDLVDMYDLSLTVPLTALGGTYLRMEPDEHPVRFDGQTMAWGADWCANGLLRLQIAVDGTITLLDHRTGQVYSGLNRFVDDGEDGNGWFHDEPIGNELRLTDTTCRFRRTAAAL